MEPPRRAQGSVDPGVAASLAEALRSMAWELVPGEFALAGFDDPPAEGDLAPLLAAGPAQVIREGGETTLLVASEALPGILRRHPDARAERGLRWIRLRTAMGWEVTGFLAHVTGELAAAGVPLGAVCGFSRDHLFVADRFAPAACEVLERLFGPPVPLE